MKSKGAKRQRRERVRREKVRRERVIRNKIQVRVLEVERFKKCTAPSRKAHFEPKMAKKHTCSDHFWQLRFWKSAQRCGARHISTSKYTKHFSFGALLEVEMLKKCTALWREEHFEVKMVKAPQVRTAFESWDVVKVDSVVVRSAFASQQCSKLRLLDHFLF